MGESLSKLVEQVLWSTPPSEWLFVIGFFLTFATFEYLQDSARPMNWRGRFRNIVYGIFVLTVGTFLSAYAFALVPGGPHMVEKGGWLKTAFYVLAYLFVTDFFFYWYHRAQHRFQALWTLHELHHSDDDMNVTSGFRTYWLDYPAQAVCISAPTLYIVGVHPTAITIWIVLTIFALCVTHANIHVNLGPLTKVVVGPGMHRIHHSFQPEHIDKNFAQIFPIFDIVFGTYYPPEPGKHPATGTPSMPADASYGEVMYRPFEVWGRLMSRR